MATRTTGAVSPQLYFDGSESKYDLWEARFLGHLHILKLKDTVLNEPVGEEQAAADRIKNPDCYAELIRLIDDKSLSLIRHDATYDGRKALKMLREHYSGKSKPRIINLYTSLTKLRKVDRESTTDYIIRAENLITALRDAGETLSDSLIIAMILGGLPDAYKPLAVHVTQNEDNVTFTDFKRRLRIYEESEKISTAEPTDNVMKMFTKQDRNIQKTYTSSTQSRSGDEDLTCFKCGLKGHRARNCIRKVWCNFCKSNTHQETICKKKDKRDNVKKVTDEHSSDYLFKAAQEETRDSFSGTS
ncbi:uncharacterized protein LOC133539959 [Nerophis ophidion]|uniref:uncharacterized protein LOC133539959 n=1 Tax=Nerophis ophidion TaxID=159077 RepID=UPI002AE0A084|nr:uncharacterized protein LOC133539959 [Nerophis ophidion]